MRDECIRDCLACGKCAKTPILESFRSGASHISPRPGWGVAIDIGTTSVVMALVSLSACQVVARHSFLNPQRAFGPDVISRISAANDGEGNAMRTSILKTLHTGVYGLLAPNHISPAQLNDVVIAGNTTMMYLLLGFPCQSLGVAPFQPAFPLAEVYPASEVFGASDITCPIRLLPFLAAFVGGDITAGLLHVLAFGAKRFLLIDLGTNGELALYDEGRLFVTATAAGPAFEGNSHGGGASMVLDDLAHLLREGLLDETGRLTQETDLFSQKEIRDLQLAKAAVRSGLEILLESADLSYDSLDGVYLAGGIGQAMNTVNASAVGLLPAELLPVTRAVGNAALGGAVRWLLEPECTGAIRRLKTEGTEINLSNHQSFNVYFMDNMCFEQ